MTFKQKLLQVWAGDPEPGFDPDDPSQQGWRLSRRDLTKIADS